MIAYYWIKKWRRPDRNILTLYIRNGLFWSVEISWKHQIYDCFILSNTGNSKFRGRTASVFNPEAQSLVRNSDDTDWILLYRSQMIHHCKFVAPFKQSSQSYWILAITWHSWRLSGNHGRPTCLQVVSSRPSGTSLYRMPERYVICDVTSARVCITMGTIGAMILMIDDHYNPTLQRVRT